MRILYRLMSGTALLTLPYFSTAQVTKATDDYVQTTVNAAPITIRVLDNDSARVGRRLKVDFIPLVNHGKAQITADSSAIVFTPDLDFRGIALVNYTIADGDGIFDCGLVVIDVAATPTPNNQEMHLFTRKAKPIRFTVPAGFVSTSAPQGATVEMVNGYTGVYQFASNPTISGVFELLFNKLENGVSKEFHVQIEVLNAPPKSLYLQDDYASTPINRTKSIDLLRNDSIYTNAPIARVDITPSGNCSIERLLRDPKSGKFLVTPDANFIGTIRFDYTVTFADGVQEMASVHLTVCNFFPAGAEFNIIALSRQAKQVLNYKVPSDFIGEYEFIPADSRTLNGGFIEFVNGQLEYTAPQNSSTTDAFSLKYCIKGGGDCQAADVKIQLINARPCAGNDCIWLGDANKDGRVDMADIFPIGENMGQYGAKRVNNSTAWSPQNTDNWRALSDTPDPKHADTNGDGIISVTDTAAIMKYYGKANSLYAERTAEESKIQTFLLNSSNATSIRPGDMIEILVLLGSSDNPAIDTRGLSFTVDYSATKIDEASLVVDFGKFNWLSRYDAFLTASKIAVKGTVDAGIVRSLDRGASGHGQVGTIRAIVVDDVVGFHEGDKPAVRFKLKNAVMIDGQGHAINIKGSELVIPIEVGNKNVALKDEDVKMFPNPTSDFAEFYLNGYNTIQSIRILDMRGREVRILQNVNSKQTRIDMSELTNGLYMAEVMTEKGRVVKKLQVIK